MNNWFWYENVEVKEFKTIEDFPQDCFGFIYEIKNTITGKFYIGKKSLYHNIKKKLTKKELAEQSGPGRKATTKRVQKESDWATYWGSNKEILAEIKTNGNLAFTRQIIKMVRTKKELTYWETAYQCKCNVLFVNSYNDNVLGKFFKKDFAPNALLHTL
jgi:hypothetical protein